MIHMTCSHHQAISVLVGFPPKHVRADGAQLLTELGVKSGDVIHVRRGTPSIISFRDTTDSKQNEPQDAIAQSAAKSIRVENPQVDELVAMGFSRNMVLRALEIAEGDLAAALELCLSGSIPDEPPTAHETAPPLRIIRRVINADNSCLFNALGYVMHRDKTNPARLRRLIADTVRHDPDQYNEAFLGKPPTEYAAWIQNDAKWGGEIELSILSKHFGVEIAAVDIETTNVYIYGQEHGSAQRVYVLYDGIHYDALARNRGDGAPEASDQTAFPPDDGEALEQAKQLAGELKSRKQYVNLAGCDLQCLVCGVGLNGQKAALQHAEATGHQNFGQTAR